MHGFGSGSKVAAADFQKAALGATAFHVVFFIFEAAQKFYARVVPNFAERALKNIAEDMFAPELIGVDIAVPGNAADAASGLK